MSTTSNTKKAKRIRMVKIRISYQVTKTWKKMSSTLIRALPSSSPDSISEASSSSSVNVPSGFMAVYVGPERSRFVIRTRFLKFPIFVSLLEEAEEEYGFRSDGGIALPCKVEFFSNVLELLDKDERKYGSLEVDEFLKVMISDVGFDSSSSRSCSPSSGYMLLPLVQRARVC